MSNDFTQNIPDSLLPSAIRLPQQVGQKTLEAAFEYQKPTDPVHCNWSHVTEKKTHSVGETPQITISQIITLAAGANQFEFRDFKPLSVHTLICQSDGSADTWTKNNEKVWFFLNFRSLGRILLVEMLF